MQTFNLTPHPNVLLALTHTPMQPLDALCELIDNAIDSFQAAKLQGNPVKHPLVIVDLPRASEVNAGLGHIQVRDNGSGLSRDQAEHALRAGFSGNNTYDSLGLFGMGFNISTGKLGRVTRFLTAQQSDKEAIEVIVDLENIRQSRSFAVPVKSVPKPDDFVSGTVVGISTWWPEGNPNHGFVRKLVQYGMPRVREEIGRRYATILREKNIGITINGEHCQPFEHCVWSDARSVERRGQGNVPAVFRFNELNSSQIRCGGCFELVDAGKKQCQQCGSASLRTIEERIRGWIGVQRFDDPTEFGIDLIRNGRAIRIGEKTAFFEFTNEYKRTLKDYPIDGPNGRIVGEVHLNHIPVDFLKQDFQRSSPEWARAMVFLRGESSLQPTQPGADQNKSTVFKLYQGYRRVRNFGRGDMYMGVWDMAENGPRRISRDVEKEYHQKFVQKLPGFYDDAEWWQLVDQADRRPLEELVECPKCTAQNLKGHDACSSCGEVLIGKDCVNVECGKKIPQSAASCSHCGKSQIPEILQPWNCQVCGSANQAELTSCSECIAPRGTLHNLSLERLLSHSSKSDELSIPACTVPLADGSHTSPLDVETYVSREPIIPRYKAKSIPLYAIKTPERVKFFVDLNHALFKSLRLRPEQMIASEVALVVYDANRRLSGKQHEGLHTLSTLCWQILQSRWQATMEDSADRLRADITDFFTALRERLPNILDGRAEDIYDDLNESQQKKMVDNILGGGMDLLKLPEMKKSGQYLHFIDESLIAALFKDNASAFFDGRFWKDAWGGLGLSNLPSNVVEDVHHRTKSLYLNCLEDLIGYLRHRQPDAIVMQRARASLLLLQQKLA
jgi:hypothetical protein